MMLNEKSQYTEKNIVSIYTAILNGSIDRFPKYSFSTNDYKIKSEKLILFAINYFDENPNNVTIAWLQDKKLSKITKILSRMEIMEILKSNFKNFNTPKYRCKNDLPSIKSNILIDIKSRNESILDLYDKDVEYFRSMGLISQNSTFLLIARMFNLKEFAFKHGKCKRWKRCTLEIAMNEILNLTQKNIMQITLKELEYYRIDEGIYKVFGCNWSMMFKLMYQPYNFKKSAIAKDIHRRKVAFIKDLVTTKGIDHLAAGKLSCYESKYIKKLFGGIKECKKFIDDVPSLNNLIIERSGA